MLFWDGGEREREREGGGRDVGVALFVLYAYGATFMIVLCIRWLLPPVRS